MSMLLLLHFPGFRNNVWDFYLGFLFLVPAFLWISYIVLKHFRLEETYHFSYFMNVYILFNALSQQVTFNWTRELRCTILMSGI